MRKNTPLSLLAIVFGLGSALPPIASATLFDHSSYDSIVRRYVNEDGWVDYSSIRKNSLSALESYFERLGEADLGGWSRNERIAFWINAYNSHVLHLLAEHPDMKKVSENFEMFNFPFKMAGERLTLNDVEHRILRNRVNPDNKKGPVASLSFTKPDPRIHFALVCGAVSCPKLRNFAYTDENVDATLTANAVIFANNSRNADVLDNHLRVSTIFKWYGKDFESLGGWRQFLSGLLDPEKRGDAAQVKTYLQNEDQKPEYLYDWTINDVKNSFK